MDVAARSVGGSGIEVNIFESGRARGSHAAKSAPVRTGIVLVGTPETIRQMAAAAAAIEPPAPIIAGAVLATRTSATPSGPLALPVPLLGSLDDLPLLAARFNLKMALICLPRSGLGGGQGGMTGEGTLVRDAVVRAGLSVREFVAIEDILSGGGGGISAAAGTLPPASVSSGDDAKRNRFTGAAPAIDLGALIGRTPYDMDRAAISAVLRGKRVIITGAGGSIGAELARVAAEFEPSLLVLMERSENALFEIDRRIATLFPSVRRRAVLHDVVDAEGTLRLCADIRPHAVFHSAAHKHVPLMEDHPAHAVTNNLFGTKSVADAAVACGAERFVMISSDKAVNPTSVMGATKRLAEMYVRGLGETRSSATPTRLSMVRFGNVLGSSASVLTIWAQQIAEGGALTITDPRMTRYFMTIPEAATLVVQSTVLDAQAGAHAAAASQSPVGVFVLDMGEPIRIADLAVRFAKAHGLATNVRLETAGSLGRDLVGRYPTPHPGDPAIDVIFSGIRPGEKIHEELAYAAEQLRPTAHPGVRAWAGPGFEPETAARVRDMVADLHAARYSQDRAAVLSAIRRHVPEMRTAPEGLSVAQSAHPQVG